MTLLFMDGMDRYGLISEVSRNFDSVGTAILLTTGGAFGGGAVKFTSNQHMEKAVAGTPQTCVVSFRINRAVPLSTQFFIYIDNSVGGALFKLRQQSGSQVDVYAAGAVVGTFTLPVGSWEWVSIKVKASNSVGAIDIEVGGVNVFTFAGDTVSFGTETCVNVRLGGNALNGNETYDDIFITDIAGSAPFNDLLPDTRIETLLPDAAGDSALFTATPAVANYLNVDDAAPDDDTTYVESSTLADKDLHNLAAIPFTVATIDVVNVFALAKNPLGGGAALKLLAKENVTEGAGAAQSLASGYGYLNELFLVNPDTAAAWTETQVNAMQAGYENG